MTEASPRPKIGAGFGQRFGDERIIFLHRLGQQAGAERAAIAIVLRRARVPAWSAPSLATALELAEDRARDRRA